MKYNGTITNFSECVKCGSHKDIVQVLYYDGRCVLCCECLKKIAKEKFNMATRVNENGKMVYFTSGVGENTSSVIEEDNIILFINECAKYISKEERFFVCKEFSCVDCWAYMWKEPMDMFLVKMPTGKYISLCTECFAKQLGVEVIKEIRNFVQYYTFKYGDEIIAEDVKYWQLEIAQELFDYCINKIGAEVEKIETEITEESSFLKNRPTFYKVLNFVGK